MLEIRGHPWGTAGFAGNAQVSARREQGLHRNVKTLSGSRERATPRPANERQRDVLGRGNVYNVTLQKVIDPASGSDQFNQPDNGTRFVAAVFQITGVSGTATDDSDSDASLTGTNQQVYQPNFNSGDFNVTPGQSETGAVTFQVPAAVSVANIQWTIGISNSTATWNVP
jgi:hypothetical protein